MTVKTQYDPFTLLEIAKMADINYNTLHSRLNGGKSLEQALRLPVRKRREKPRFTPQQLIIAENNGISKENLYSRLKLGYSAEAAISTPLGTQGKGKAESAENVAALLELKAKKTKATRIELKEIQKKERLRRRAINKQLEALLEIECCSLSAKSKCTNCKEIEQLRRTLG